MVWLLGPLLTRARSFLNHGCSNEILVVGVGIEFPSRSLLVSIFGQGMEQDVFWPVVGVLECVLDRFVVVESSGFFTTSTPKRIHNPQHNEIYKQRHRYTRLTKSLHV